ncbi:MAG: hypothetical protein ACC707_02085 [Thiohalomonadales bacterium]
MSASSPSQSLVPAKDEKPAASPEPAKKANNVSKEQLNKLAKRAELFIAIGLVAGMVGLYIFGSQYWDERYYTPDEGLGYYLGMGGGIIMLLAYCYTAFKYVPALRTRAVMKYWLTVHLYFGIIGPYIIIVHSTFRFGSLNGAIALVATFLVFLSGVMGRYLYSKTHYGLGGQKARVNDLQQVLQVSGAKIRSKRLDTFTESVMSHRDTLTDAIWEFTTFGWRSRWVYLRLTDDMRHHLREMAREAGWDSSATRQKHRAFKRQLRYYISVLKKVALFRVYERFFSFWRNAHVPLLYLLLMSGIVHVIAVHMY